MMKNREPHHFCGVLILLLALVSIYAWVTYPPETYRHPVPPTVENAPETSPEPSEIQEPPKKRLATTLLITVP